MMLLTRGGQVRRALMTLLVWSAATGARAHHSPALYDLQKTVTLTGNIVKYEWGNPHVYMFIRSTTDTSGAPWQVETGSPTMMERAGWFKDSLRVNDQVVVEVNPARNSAQRVALLSSLRKADGSLAYSRGTLAPAARSNPVAASSLTGNWLPTSPAFARFVGPPSQWPLTEKGKAALTTYTDAKKTFRTAFR